MTANRYAVVQGEKVTNIILWDDGDAFDAPSGTSLISAPEEVSIGWGYANGEWVEPPSIETETPVIVEDPTVIEAKMEALRQLVDLGITDPVARTIVGLPPA